MEFRLLKDGYVGLVKSKDYDYTAPLVTAMRVTIDEITSNADNIIGISDARISITNLDISPDSLTGITSIRTELGIPRKNIDGEIDYSIPTTDLPLSWTPIETYTVTNDPTGVTGTNNTIIFTIHNVPSSIDNFYNKFRFTLYNYQNEAAVFLPAVADTDGYAGAFTEVGYYFTFSDGGIDYSAEEFAGFSTQMYAEAIVLDKEHMMVNDVPIISNTDNDVYLATGISTKAGLSLSLLDGFIFVESPYFYALGSSGTGYLFNDIDDLTEIVAVTGLEAEAYVTDPLGTIVEATWDDADDVTRYVKGSSLRLRWDNMYAHATMHNQMHANGETRTVTQKQFTGIKYYTIYMFVSDTGYPTNLYPVDAAEPDGSWYNVKDIDARPKSASTMPTVMATIDNLPPGKFVSFFVGAYTATKKTDITMETAE